MTPCCGYWSTTLSPTASSRTDGPWPFRVAEDAVEVVITARSVRDALVVSTGGQRVVAQDLQVRAHPLQDRGQEHGREQGPGPCRYAREVELGGVEHHQGAGDGGRELLDPLDQRPGRVLALERDDADAF